MGRTSHTSLVDIEAMTVLADHKGLMGDPRNKPWQNVIGVLGLVAILATCHRLVVGILGG